MSAGRARTDKRGQRPAWQLELKNSRAARQD